MKKNFITLLVIALFTSCSAQTTNYKNTLISGVKKVEKRDNISTDFLIKCIPNTDEEYTSFYSLTYPDSNYKVDEASYYKLIKLFYTKALSGEKGVYKKLLEMSKFVDGEFAESYFEDLDFIISKDKPLFCKAYSLADSGKIKRIESVYKENCK